VVNVSTESWWWVGKLVVMGELNRIPVSQLHRVRIYIYIYILDELLAQLALGWVVYGWWWGHGRWSLGKLGTFRGNTSQTRSNTREVRYFSLQNPRAVPAREGARERAPCVFMCRLILRLLIGSPFCISTILASFVHLKTGDILRMADASRIYTHTFTNAVSYT